MQTQATHLKDRQTRESAFSSPKTPNRGPSTDFIISAEAFEALAESDPNRARYEIVLRLYDSCYSRIYSFLRRSVSPDVADDLAQETFLRLLSHKKLERMSISISYLFRIAQNLVRRRYNAAARRRAILDEGLKHEAEYSGRWNNPSENFIAIESEDLGRAIEHLSPREHEVLRLTICEGLSYSTVARVFGVPVSTVNNWKHRALLRLREFIDEANSDVQQPVRISQPSASKRGSSPRSARQQASRSREAGSIDSGEREFIGSQTSQREPSRAAG